MFHNLLNKCSHSYDTQKSGCRLSNIKETGISAPLCYELETTCGFADLIWYPFEGAKPNKPCYP